MAPSDHHDMIQAFSLVFREDDDRGKERDKETPKREIIERNLNTFLKRWRDIPNSQLTAKAMVELEHLRKHVNEGCLYGIPPGHKTERNEQLHRLLNRSLISGATRISVELAIKGLYYKYLLKIAIIFSLTI